MDSKIRTLRDRTVGWLVNVYKALDKPELVKKAWELCRSGDFNLSYDSLTSRAIRDLLRELPHSDPEFFAELTQTRTYAPPVLTKEQEAEEDYEDNDPINEPGDDSAVPLEAVFDHQAKLTDPDFELEYIIGDLGGLEAAGEAEETTVESVEGVVIDTTPETVE